MTWILGSPSHDEGTCASENNCGPLDIIDESLSKEPTSGLALQPIQSDLLSLNIRPAGGPDYNIHELPSLDGKIYKYDSLINGNQGSRHSIKP